MRFIRDLTFDTAKLLNRIYKQSRHYQVRQRAHCILLSYKGVTIPELIEFFQVSRRTIYYDPSLAIQSLVRPYADQDSLLSKVIKDIADELDTTEEIALDYGIKAKTAIN